MTTRRIDVYVVCLMCGRLFFWHDRHAPFCCDECEDEWWRRFITYANAVNNN